VDAECRHITRPSAPSIEISSSVKQSLTNNGGSNMELGLLQHPQFAVDNTSWWEVFTRERYCYRPSASWPSQFCLSVCPSVTRVDQQGCARDLLSRDRDETLQLSIRWPRPWSFRDCREFWEHQRLVETLSKMQGLPSPPPEGWRHSPLN